MSQQAAELSYRNEDRNGLRYIAKRQRTIMICILIYFAVIVLEGVTPLIFSTFGRSRISWALIAAFFLGVGIILLANYIVALINVFGLAIRLYGTFTGVVLGILTLVPLVNLVILLIVNAKATKTLRANGVKVGFFGASGRIE